MKEESRLLVIEMIIPLEMNPPLPNSWILKCLSLLVGVNVNKMNSHAAGMNHLLEDLIQIWNWFGPKPLWMVVTTVTSGIIYTPSE